MPPLAPMPSKFPTMDIRSSITITVRGTSAIKGARYIDNTPIAWGRVDATGTLLSGFGIDLVIYDAITNVYEIRLNYTDPYTGNQVQINNGSSVVATIEGSQSSLHCLFINASPVQYHNGSGKNRFFIRVSRNVINGGALDCEHIAHGFMFVVYGRP
jgi:hypothetical protein